MLSLERPFLKKWETLEVMVQGGAIIVTLPQFQVQSCLL